MAKLEWSNCEGELLSAETDAHLAEIDFEHFRTEDLMQAYFDEEERSVNEMSICKSEMLFSSINDSSNSPLDPLLQSNMEPDSCRSYEPNKRHYTLAFRESTMANSINLNQSQSSENGHVTSANLPDFNRINNNETDITDVICNSDTNSDTNNNNQRDLTTTNTNIKVTSKVSKDVSPNLPRIRHYPTLDFLKVSEDSDKSFCQQILRKSEKDSNIRDDCENLVFASNLDQSLHDFDSLVKLLPPNLNVHVKQREVKEAWPARNNLKSNFETTNNNGSEEKREIYEKQRENNSNFDRETTLTQVKIRRSRRKNNFPKSGSENDLCDRVDSDEEKDEIPEHSPENHVGTSAEYPVSKSTEFKSHCSNYSHQRALFKGLYRATERLVTHQEDIYLSQLVFTADFIPSLYNILADGLKNELITSFGGLKSSVWRIIEAISQRGDFAIADLVMIINDKKFKVTNEKDLELRKLTTFVIGLLNMSCLHIWFDRLRWNLDVLLRFYRNNAMICGLNRDTKLLHDELILCLKRLFALPLMSAKSSNFLDVAEIDNFFDFNNSRRISTPNIDYNRRSRIPRPISLPKRLEHRFDSPAEEKSESASSSTKLSDQVRSKSRPRSNYYRDSKSFEVSKNEKSESINNYQSSASGIVNRRFSQHRKNNCRGEK